MLISLAWARANVEPRNYSISTCKSATLYGHIEPNGAETFVWFEWGEKPDLGKVTIKQQFTDATDYYQVLVDLKENITYFYRSMASNSNGTSVGRVLSFTTAQCSASLTMPPIVDYIVKNKEWIFSGIGVLIISALILFTRNLINRSRIRNKQKPDEGRAHAAEQQAPDAQKLGWGPPVGLPPGAWIDARDGQFLPWNRLKIELEERVLIQLGRHVPPDCTLVVRDHFGRKDWTVRILNSGGEEVGHIWIGGNPDEGWDFDGLIRAGVPETDTFARVWQTFRRYSDGSYLRVGSVEDAHRSPIGFRP